MKVLLPVAAVCLAGCSPRSRWLRFGLLCLFAAASLVTTVANPTATSACSAESPTFDFAVRNASAIARVTILNGRDGDLVERFRIDRVLKGALPAEVVLERPRAHLCGDTISFFAGAEGGRIGQSAIVAFDVTFYAQVIHPVWAVLDNRVGGSASWPDGVSTLLELEPAIVTSVGQVPNTDASPEFANTEEPPWIAAPLLLFAVALAIGYARRHRTGTTED